MVATFTPYFWKASVLESKCDTEKPFNDDSAGHEMGQISIVAPHEKGPEIDSLIAWDTNGTETFNYEQIPDVVESAKERVDMLSKYVCSNERFLTLIEADIIVIGTDDEDVRNYINDFNGNYGVRTKFDFSNQPHSEAVESALFCLAGATHGAKITSYPEYLRDIPEKCRYIKREEIEGMPYLWMIKPDTFSGKITLGGLVSGTKRKPTYLVAQDFIQKVLH